MEKSPSALARMKEKTQKIQSNAKEVVRNMPIVLTEQQLTRLKEHKYASEGVTLFDPVMQEFWKWLVQYCPLWVAPNLVTIVGLALNIGTSVLLMIETNGAKEEVKYSMKKIRNDCCLVFSLALFSNGFGFIYLPIIGCNRW